MFFNDLPDEVTEQIAHFADDTVFVTSGTAAEGELNNELKILQKECDCTKITINEIKTEILSMNKNHKLSVQANRSTELYQPIKKPECPHR